MGRGWRLGGRWFAEVRELDGPATGAGCSFRVVRQDGEGPRQLLQLWEPLPPPRVLDAIREDFLRAFDQASPLDPGPARMGHDAKAAWFLQKLEGIPYPRLWGSVDAPGRKALEAAVAEALASSRTPRLADPEVVGLKPGRVLAPRVLGPEPWPGPGLALPDAPPGPGTARVWEDLQALADPASVPIRGRSRELTYLKSLMLGLGSPATPERAVFLTGEEGLDQDRLCDWAGAAAQTEGRWVVDVELLPGERAGAFLGRILGEALTGLEADLYAAEPGLARSLARRMASFAFLRGGRKPVAPDRRLEVDEVEAALGALAWADALHPRLFLLRGLELMGVDVLDLLRGLTGHSRLPWILSFRGAGTCQGLKSWLDSAGNGPGAAIVVLDRVDEAGLQETLTDALGAHRLPEAYTTAVCASALGNPGLLRRILDMAILRGDLVREGGAWTLAPGAPPPPGPGESEIQAILAARAARLEPQARRALKALALAEAPVAAAVLARVLGQDPDAAEAPLQALQDAQLAVAADGRLRVPSALVRELALEGSAPGELRAVAAALLRALEAEAGSPVLAVRLRARAQDPVSAVEQVIEALRRERPGPAEAQAAVDEALGLGPGPVPSARLHACLSDAWAQVGDHARARAALAEAFGALGEPAPGSTEEEWAARFHRKAACLEIGLRAFKAAHQSIRSAAACLADHPFHGEQVRLRLALGRLHAAQGAVPKAARALEEGLLLLARRETADGREDHVALLLELGRVQGQRCQFEQALETLQSARRFFEHAGDRRGLAAVLGALGQIHLGMGQTEAACRLLDEALAHAGAQEDPGLKAACRLDLGIARGFQQSLGPALAHLDSALRRFQGLQDPVGASRALLWKARTLAVLGDLVQADFLAARAAEVREDLLTPQERGDAAFIAGELDVLRGDWPAALRRFQEAANRYGEAGLVWRERLARLRYVQAEALEGGEAAEAAWTHLERLKGPVEGSGSRWLEVEWRRAHALLLEGAGPAEAVLAEALSAWGDVRNLARELRFPHLAMEAGTREADLLLARGERLGARSTIQDAAATFQELWSRVPAHLEAAFAGRADVRAFRSAAEAAGVPFLLPAKSDPLADWSPTQANLPLPTPLRGHP